MGIFEDSADNELGEETALRTMEESISADESTGVLDSLVGEGKKFKTIEALAKGKVLADSFIEKLLFEKRQLEKELIEKKKIEDFMTEIKSLNSANQDGLSNGQIKPLTEQTPNETALDPQALTEHILKAIEERNRVSTEEQNVTKVREALRSLYGNSWMGNLETFANNYGMNRETVDNWVKTNPDAVIKAVSQSFQESKPVQTPSNKVSIPFGTSRVNSGELSTYADFQNVKKTDPARYNSREFQVLMHDTAVRMGDSFFVKR